MKGVSMGVRKEEGHRDASKSNGSCIGFQKVKQVRQNNEETL